MTGYGKATVEAGTKKITAEVRSLNSKQLDLSVKTPAAYRSKEFDIRTVAAEVVVRGKADVYVTVEGTGATGGASLNKALFGAYYRQIAEAMKDAGVYAGIHTGFDPAAIVSAIMRLPDVMTTETAGGISDEESNALASVCAKALAAFDKFRKDEGEVLMADITGRVKTICELLTGVEPFEKARVGAVRARILDNIAAMGVVVDGNRLEQEIVFWVEKLDITEEKVRLTKHCDYFRQTATSDEEGVGRKLGFIAQEMGREINTLGSKANDAEIQKIVVRMKDELEKIKEQLLNIL
jgi:uncharacterized protein (TIGR00255 family)